MTTALVSDVRRLANRSLAEVQQQLGGVPLWRVCSNPPPGFADVADVDRLRNCERRLYELVDGTLVEKDVGFQESMIAMLLGRLLGNFVEERDLGVVLGADGALQVLPDQVRIPDVCFLSWGRFPNRELPAEPVPELAPDLAVEVLSAGNTTREMERKLHDYFTAGVRLVWYVHPETRAAQVFTSPTEVETLAADGILRGGDVLPSLELPLAVLFQNAARR
jgi:Uma2 family endonuclease